MPRIVIKFIRLLVAAAIGVVAGNAVYFVLKKTVLHEVTIPYQAPAGAPTLHVFFLGNSYTFFNSLPQMVGAVAASDSANPVDIQTDSGTKSGGTLEDLWDDSGIREQFKGPHWDYLILQEHSQRALIAAWFPSMQQAMTNWANLARSHNTKVLIFETWARKPGTDWYDPAKYPGLNMVNPEQMQTQIDTITNTIAQTSPIRRSRPVAGCFGSRLRPQNLR